VSSEFIFVYGTLRKEAAHAMHDVIVRHGDYFSHGSMQGKLFELGGYPGVIESVDPVDAVQGELYRINDHDQLLLALDEYEQCSDRFPPPHEYLRKKLSISLPNGGTILAWVYVYNREVAGLEQIESGDYVAFLDAY